MRIQSFKNIRGIFTSCHPPRIFVTKLWDQHDLMDSIESEPSDFISIFQKDIINVVVDCTSMMRMHGVLKIKHKPCTSLGLQSSGQDEFRGVCSGYSADKSLWSLDQDSWSSGARQGSPRKIMEANKFPRLLVGPVRHKYPAVSKI